MYEEKHKPIVDLSMYVRSVTQQTTRTGKFLTIHYKSFLSTYIFAHESSDFLQRDLTTLFFSPLDHIFQSVTLGRQLNNRDLATFQMK